MSGDAVNGYLLSPGQERLWHLWSGGQIARMPAVRGRFRLDGPVEPAALCAALGRLAERHEILRAVFLRLPEMGVPLQAARDCVPPAIGARELGVGPEDAPLVAQLEDGVLGLAMPAFLADGTTLLGLAAAILRELNGEAEPEEPLQYFDLAQWQRYLLEQDAPAAPSWGAGSLTARGGALPALPALRPRAEGPFAPRRVACPLPPRTEVALDLLVARLGATRADVLAAAWAALLLRLSGGTPAPVALLAEGRAFTELTGALGPLAGPVPLELRPDADTRFADLVVAARDARVAAEDLRHHLPPPAGDAIAAFPVEHLLQPAGEAPCAMELATEGEPFLIRLAALSRADSSLAIFLDHDAAACPPGAAGRMAEQFATLLRDALARPEAALVALEILGEAERRLIADFHGPVVAVPEPWQPVQQAIAARAAAEPGRLALREAGKELTAAELEARVQALAARLRLRGVGPDRAVALFLPRGVAHVVAMLGVLRAGGAWMPLSPDLPAERAAFILADSGARHVVTLRALASSLPARGEPDILLLDQEAGAPPAVAFALCAPSHAAYILYTSGSTGQPKGVVVPHGALANQMAWIARAFPLGPDDVLLHKTALSFDASVWEVLSPLMQGAVLSVAAPGLEHDAAALVEMLQRERVTALQLVPSLLRVLIDSPGFAACTALRHVFCGGEALTADLARRFRAVHPAALVNLYGPTETTIQVCAEVVDAEEELPSLGRPIDNVRIHVVDEAMRLVPVGARGEILIGGAAPARGYVNLPELTASRFIPDPFSGAPGAVLYRSGDFGAWREDGRLDFFGRTDHQVKLRGYRIEFGEIEASALVHPAVALCAVLRLPDANGTHHLVCNYSCSPGAELDAAGLRAWLQARLPDYMVPTRFVQLDAFPVTSSGKIDRTALADLPREEPPGEAHAPRDTIEMRLERVWETVLDVRPVGVDRNFFELGGHSLLAVRLMAEVRREFACNLPLVSLFQAPTVAGQAALLRAATAGDPVLVPINRGLAEQRPVFLVHPTGGSVLCYRALSRRLGPSRPVHALQDPGLEGTADYTSVEELAGFYIARIREAVAGGPYCLAGWSSGGIVAYEMARQLVARGEEIGFVAMIDSAPPAGDAPAREDGELIQSIGRLIAHASGLPPPELRTLAREDGLARLHGLALEAGLLPDGAGPERVERLFAVFRRNVDVVRRYRPGTYHRRVLLLTATEPVPEPLREAAMQHRSDLPDLGWGRVCWAEVTPVPAHHLSIVEEPGVGHVAARLRSALADVDRANQLGDRVLFSLLGH